MLRRRGRGRASISLQEMMPEALQPEQLPTLPTTVLSREGTDVVVRPLNTTMRNTLPELSRHRSASTEFGHPRAGPRAVSRRRRAQSRTAKVRRLPTGGATELDRPATELSRHRSARTESTQNWPHRITELGCEYCNERLPRAGPRAQPRAVVELSRAPPRCAASRPAARRSFTGLRLSSAATGARAQSWPHRITEFRMRVLQRKATARGASSSVAPLPSSVAHRQGAPPPDRGRD